MGSSDRLSYESRRRESLSQSRAAQSLDAAYQDALIGKKAGNQVANNLRILIAARKLTVDQAAAGIGISKTTLEQALIHKRLTNRTLNLIKLWVKRGVPAG